MTALRRIKDIPAHPLLLSAYPVLALFANNFDQVSSDVFWRPLAIALGVSLALLVILRALLGNWRRAALLATLLLLMFFAYGHVYDLKKSAAFLAEWMRHRYLAPFWLGLTGLGGFVILRKGKRAGMAITPVLNLVSLVILVMPLAQIGLHVLTASRQDQSAVVHLPAPTLNAPAGKKFPSIYFIVFDTYMRSDALLKDMGYDNRAFVQNLEELGFYVPDCSRVNYSYTQGSLAAALNMDYLDQLRDEIKAAGLDTNVFALIKHSKVRQQLESLGYQTVAFDSGYEWSRITDADIYLGLNRDTFATQRMSRFEAMLVKSTLLRVYTDAAIRASQSGLAQVNSPFGEHIELQRFILARLPELAADPAPKFVFAHILIPHWPYVFLPDGSVRVDPDFDQDNLTEEQLRQGYTDSVSYLNNQIITVVESILERSATPPLIVMFGDHGLRDDNRLQNFAALYLPEGNAETYNSITPVNYFRVGFNNIFGAAMPLLDDHSFRIVDSAQVNEIREDVDSAPRCR